MIVRCLRIFQMLGGGLDGGPWVTLRLPTAISLGYASAFVLSEHAAVRNPLDNGSADFTVGIEKIVGRKWHKGADFALWVALAIICFKICVMRCGCKKCPQKWF